MDSIDLFEDAPVASDHRELNRRLDLYSTSDEIGPDQLPSTPPTNRKNIPRSAARFTSPRPAAPRRPARVTFRRATPGRGCAARGR